MQRYHGSEKASNVATRVNVGSHKVKLSTTTAITPLPLAPSKNSGANVLSSGYIHVKKEKIWFIPFKQGSKSGNTPFLFYKMPVANLKRQRGNHFIHHTFLTFIFLHIEAGCPRFQKQIWTRGDGSKAMTLRLHGCKLRSVHSSSNYTWFIYRIICPIRCCMSNMSPYFSWQYNAFQRCDVKWSLDWKLDIRSRRIGKIEMML